MLHKMLRWYLGSDSKSAHAARRFVRRRPFMRKAGRVTLFAIRDPRMFLIASREWMFPALSPRIVALAEARDARGWIDFPDLVRLGPILAARNRILYISDAPSHEQIVPYLKRRANASVEICKSVADLHALQASKRRFDLLIFGQTSFVPIDDPAVRGLLKGLNTPVFVVNDKARGPSAGATWIDVLGSPLADVALGVNGRTIVFLNDMGFRYGAGTALSRQCASLLLAGWNVAVLAWEPADVPITRDHFHVGGTGQWLGMHSLRHLHADKGLNDACITTGVMEAVRRFAPSHLVTGNLHGTGWPLTVLSEIQRTGVPVVAYMHDSHFVTGRCAAPLDCRKYITGCDASCPTPNEYPRLEPAKIHDAWLVRAKIFTGEDRTAIAGNSVWTTGLIRQRFGHGADSALLPLALNERLFSPIPKSAARRALGIPEDRPVVLMGAVDMKDRWKGGPIFRAVHAALSQRQNVSLVLFGQSSGTLKSTASFGYIKDARVMPLLYSAADVFVSTAIAESFGQTLLEASACGTAAIAFDVGGVSDVVKHEKTGLLVESGRTDLILEAINSLLQQPDLLSRMGRAARQQVEAEFCLRHQAEAWTKYLLARAKH